MKLKSILEATTVFKAGTVPVMVKLVFWDEKGGLKDPKKVNEILRVLERNLTMKKSAYKDIDIKSVMDGFKYYSATDKLIGNYPKHVFLPTNKPAAAISMKNCNFDHELLKVSKTLEVKQKTV